MFQKENKCCHFVLNSASGVVPEHQCAVKQETKKAQEDKDKPNSTTRDSGSDEENSMGSRLTNINCKLKAIRKVLVILKLLVYQKQYESPSGDDFKKITAFPLGDSEEDSMKCFQDITEITILTLQDIVEFSKMVPGFDTIFREDQITLLKACSNEAMILRIARKYDMKTDCIFFANNQPYTRENYRSAVMGDSVDSIFHFCRTMCILEVDNAEYALLSAIVLFSERPCLLQPKKIEKIQEYYMDTLRCYIMANRPAGRKYFASLLFKLFELRSLGNMNSELCFSLKV
ncbi:ecdysone receptor [Trichonephila clavata]|uniref:Ecdysone receptor n=1 Tax=Trichonephila clavata TaxID=2740835 RepID=A0A8X6HEB0_TRICU|nr:ecdysone receptor [Trichonephila clavata]